MAKTIATIGGVGLAPGISKNRRLYTSEHVARAVAAAQTRLAAGDEPMVMLTHHAADDSSREIAASLTGVSLDETGQMRWTAGIADTPAGRDIASLADTSDGKPPHLRGVSIRGHWTGTVRKVKGPDGDPVETGDGLELDGLDFTRKPGIAAAQVDTFAWSGGTGPAETTARVPIFESVQEAVVVVTEDTTEEAAQTAAPAGTTYADPGYLPDKKKRYPLNNAGRIRAAWSYINQAKNAAQYTAPQLKRIKGKIKAAMKGIGATVAAENWVYWPAEVTEADIAEDGSGDGSFSVSASNGPLNVCVSSYSVDPADLDLILRAAADAACAAMKTIDPDMDGDMDVPGADAEDTDHDMDGESASESCEPVALAGTAAPLESAPVVTSPPETAEQTESEDPAMSETPPLAEAQIPASAGNPSSSNDPDTDTNQLNDSNPADNQDDAGGNSFEAFLAQMISLISQQASAEGKVNPAYAKLVADLVMSQSIGNNGPDPAASVGATGAGSVPAPTISSVAGETQVAHAVVSETQDDLIARKVAEAMVTERQKMVEQGAGPSRKGLVRGVGESAYPASEASQYPEGWPDKPLHEYTDAERKQFEEPYLVAAVLGQRGDR